MHDISVSIVYATEKKQWIKEMLLPRGANVSDLVEKSGFMNGIEELREKSIEDLHLGVYAQKANLDDLLEEGDRVEIYRPLKVDPKEVRRQLADIGKTIGKAKKGEANSP